jgi:hypothetical protein
LRRAEHYPGIHPTSKKKLFHTEFQKEIARGLLHRPGAILRQRQPRPPHSSLNPHTKAVHKEGFEGHYWAELETYRYCQVCNPPNKRPGRPRKALQELPLNAPNNAKRSRQGIHKTIHSCSKCSIPICYNSSCWKRHLLIP